MSIRISRHTSDNRLRIVAVLPGLADHGGIQRHNRTLCKVLTAYAAQREASLEIVSLRDPKNWLDSRYISQSVIGCGGNRYRFAARVLTALARPYDLLIIGVVDFGLFVVLSHLLRPRIPVFTITHGVEVWVPRSRFERAAVRGADRILSVSADTAKSVVDVQGAEPGVVQVITTPLDPYFIAGIDAWRASGESTIHTRLLTITRMNVVDVNKGVDQVIVALPAVRANVPDVNYTVIGDGDDRSRLEQLARDHGVDDIVRFVGQVPDEQLYAYLGGTDVFILPSSKEGFGIVFLEAMAFGKPVIAGAHGGAPEVVADGETGILVRRDDQTALTTAMTSLLQDEAKRRAMGEAGVRRVRTVYSYDRFASTVARALDDLLHGDQGDPPIV